ncbi:MAG TPA: gamma-glutamyltransferase [Bryobacteraceae bacterium]|nr:gamma-glutamyltransferase [Bryobacteraceae bacterium]
MPFWLLLLPIALSLQAQTTEDEGFEPVREHARSVVSTRYGIVASSHTLASAAGVKILEAGGNAIDAAIATNAVMGLVEPTGNGIGGDLFAIVYEAKTGKLHGLNASGWAPTGLTPEFLKTKNESKMPERGIWSVTVPGAVAGWDALHGRFGRMKWAELFAPAIFYSEEGFPVTEIIGQSWSFERGLKILRMHANSEKVYMPSGKTPQPGDWFRNPDLARSLRAIAADGRAAFYKGAIAKSILDISRELGGTFTAEDLAQFEPEWVAPISTSYRGWTVSELPPNGQGIAALTMLNIMEQFPLGEWGHNSPRALHTMIEAKKLAYADMLKHVGDPRFSKIPVAELVSKEFARERAKLIGEKAACKVVPAQLTSVAGLPGADTIYLSVVDREGNMVSLIQSNYLGFGSGVVPAATGFMLQNRGALFTLEADQPNTLAPRKRPLHTIIPGFLQKDDTRIAFGIMGGWNQAQAHAQFVANTVDFGMNVQQALESARFTKVTFEGCAVSLESRIPESVRTELSAKGHEVIVARPYAQRVGGGQAVMRNGRGINFGGSDPRKDGAALPESPRFR